MIKSEELHLIATQVAAARREADAKMLRLREETIEADALALVTKLLPKLEAAARQANFMLLVPCMSSDEAVVIRAAEILSRNPYRFSVTATTRPPQTGYEVLDEQLPALTIRW